ncbi:MAG: beta-propeller domain-containing protein, partial [Deltaproteobacteria bacterium]|nr:beta-propeller domain-containing protein [Deltaproteobacteria bacterium]
MYRHVCPAAGERADPFRLVARATLVGLVCLTAFASCGGAPPTSLLGPPPATTAGTAPSPALATPNVAAPAPTTQPIIEAVAELPPPPVIATPMAGEPDDRALAAVRLRPVKCQDVVSGLVEGEVKRMRANLDRAYQNWKRNQVDCWRWSQRTRHRIRPPRVRMGASSVSGGYGKSSGIGLGSIGSIGHGAGSAKRARRAQSASHTNTQVAGVDEADIVKNDGAYIYLAMNGALRIVEALNPRPISVTRLQGEARMLFVKGDRAVVYVAKGKAQGRKRCTYAYDCMFAGDGTGTEIQVFDVSNRANPRLTRRIKLSGSLMAARRIGNAVHTVVSDGDPMSGARRYPTRPSKLTSCQGQHTFVQAYNMYEQLKRDHEKTIRASFSLPSMVDQGTQRSLCSSALQTPIQDGQAFTSVVSFDLTADQAAPTTATIASRPGAVFASTGALYMSVPHFRNRSPRGWYSFYAAHDEISDVHKFTIGAEPAQTAYRGSGVVPGRVLNQFSMDEWYGYLRIATTKGRAPSPKAESMVSVDR